MTKPRDEFIGLLDNSRAVAWIVAEWLTTKNYDCRIVPGTTAPNETSRFEHSDLGDIEITQRVEVKHWPNIDFQSIEQIPYPAVIVDEAYKINRRAPETLFAYVIVNASKTGCAVIHRSTRKHWFERVAKDGREGNNRNFVFCPKEFITYKDISRQ